MPLDLARGPASGLGSKANPGPAQMSLQERRQAAEAAHRRVLAYMAEQHGITDSQLQQDLHFHEVCSLIEELALSSRRRHLSLILECFLVALPFEGFPSASAMI